MIIPGLRLCKKAFKTGHATHNSDAKCKHEKDHFIQRIGEWNIVENLARARNIGKINTNTSSNKHHEIFHISYLLTYT